MARPGSSVRDGRLRGDDWRIENKTENVIDRRTGAAQHPRSNERVVEGTEFDMQIVLQVFDNDGSFEYVNAREQRQRGADALQAVVADGLTFVQLTGLGGGDEPRVRRDCLPRLPDGRRTMEALARLKLRPLGVWTTPWQADSLVGALACAWARSHGVAALRRELLDPLAR